MSTQLRRTTERPIRDPFEWDPAWDKAPAFPIRFPCTEEEYLALDSNLLLEFSDGFLEVLPMPTQSHQMIVRFSSRGRMDPRQGDPLRALKSNPEGDIVSLTSSS